jgi:hypothetical protein
MSDSRRHRKPKTQTAPAGGPPRPPKKTARGLEDGSPDAPRKKLSAAHRAELARWLVAHQKFGQLIHWHPHIHALVTEGVFLPDGTFLPLPKLATEPSLKLWERSTQRAGSSSR